MNAVMAIVFLDFLTIAIKIHYAGRSRTLINIEKITDTDVNNCRTFCARRKEFVEKENEFILEESHCEVRSLSSKISSQ